MKKINLLIISILICLLSFSQSIEKEPTILRYKCYGYMEQSKGDTSWGNIMKTDRLITFNLTENYITIHYTDIDYRIDLMNGIKKTETVFKYTGIDKDGIRLIFMIKLSTDSDILYFLYDNNGIIYFADPIK